MSISSPPPASPKPATCDFRIINLPPGGNEYEEVATLTPTRDKARTPESFKKAVHEDVCRVAGDLVVTEINGNGEYVRGTVLRKRAPAAAAP